MKNTALILATLGLFAATTAGAQQIPVKKTVDARAPSPAVVTPGAGRAAQRQEMNGNPGAQEQQQARQVLNNGKSAHAQPDLNKMAGVIRIDFGVAKQGESFTTFFPFNITTLENVETANTPTLTTKEYERFVRLANKSEVTQVKLASGTLLDRSTQSVAAWKRV